MSWRHKKKGTKVTKVNTLSPVDQLLTTAELKWMGGKLNFSRERFPEYYD